MRPPPGVSGEQLKDRRVDIARIDQIAGATDFAVDGIELAQLVQLAAGRLSEQPAVDVFGIRAKRREEVHEAFERVRERVQRHGGEHAGLEGCSRCLRDSARGHVPPDIGHLASGKQPGASSGVDAGFAEAGEGQEAGRIDESLLDNLPAHVLAAGEFGDEDDEVVVLHGRRIQKRIA